MFKSISSKYSMQVKEKPEKQIKVHKPKRQDLVLTVGREYLTKYNWTGELQEKGLGHYGNMVRLIRCYDKAPMLLHEREILFVVE